MSKKPEKSDEKALASLTEAYMDTLKDERVDAAEPFDLYVQKVHSSVYSDQEKCRSRVIQGYNILMQELSK